MQTLKPKESSPVLRTDRLLIRLANDGDVGEVMKYLERNREFLQPFEPRKPVGYYSAEFWLEQFRRSVQEFHADQAVRFFLFSGTRVVGTANLTQIVRGPFQGCQLGYSLGESDQGQGLMTEALQAIARYAFEELKLHRIQAAYMPDNTRSAAVLKKAGFEIEGRARDYVRIDGQWREHVLVGRVNDAWRVER
jgi:ribosomal-protein-alanine N-acetyltransferase